MRYVGGKSRIAGWVAENIQTIIGDRTRYTEPFVGSGAVFARIAPLFAEARCGDAHEDLILLWKEIAAGWVPPEHVSRETYVQLRNAPPSAMRAFVGYGSSFSGKWFGGYVDSVWDAHHLRYTKPYAQAASRSLVKVANIFAAAKIIHQGYESWDFGPDDVVYCDPPYADTLGYPAAGERFDSAQFWKCARSWSDAGALVIVSEGTAPAGWSVLAARSRKAMLRVATGEANQDRVERLYVVKA